jgi:uncharacterized protein (TIGR03435 family)
VLTVVRTGSKLKEGTAPDSQPALVSRVFPNRILLAARNATMQQFASMLQRAVFDRPVLDKTELRGKYDFDLEWTPDDTTLTDLCRPLGLKTSKSRIFSPLFNNNLGYGWNRAAARLKYSSSTAFRDLRRIENQNRCR